MSTPARTSGGRIRKTDTSTTPTTDPTTTPVTTTTTPTSSGSGTAAPATITVSTAAELLNALHNCKGGETILLKEGIYGQLNLSASNIPAFASQVIIASADATHPAVLNGVDANGVGNLKFSALTFDYHATAGAALSIAPFNFSNCTNITISGSKFDGDMAAGLNSVDDGYGTGSGLRVASSSNVVVENNSFTDFYRGGLFLDVTNLTVSGNDISKISSDGLDFINVDNVSIKSNHIHDFVFDLASSSHADMIQFWTTGTTSPSTNIKITDNFLDAGAGNWTQSIFMSQDVVGQGLTGTSLNYQNVTISNNVIVNGHAHGITVGETNGLVIDNNTLIQQVSAADGGSISIPKINIAAAATNVVITDNVVPATDGTLAHPSAGWIVSNNLIAQRDNLEAGNFVGNLYADALDRTHSTLSDYQAISGSFVQQAGAGALLSSLLATGEVGGYVTAQDKSASGFMVQSFDASHLFTNAGKVDMTGAKVVWNFGDGTAGTGVTTDHVYSKVGLYEATATITLLGGKVLTIDHSVLVASDRLLDLNFDGNARDGSPVENVVLASSATFEAGQTGQAVRLNGGAIEYKTGTDFSGNSEFTILADFKKDTATDQGGRLVYFSGAFVVTVGTDGLEVVVSTTGGDKWLSAPGIGLNDTDWHRMALTYSAETGTASLYVDGAAVASIGGLTGIKEAATNANLYVGGAFGGSFTGLIDNVHYISDALNSTQISTGDPLTAWAKSGADSNTAIASYITTHPIVAEAPWTAGDISSATFALV